MTFRTALRQNPVITFALLLFGGWMLITMVHVFNTMEPVWGIPETLGSTTYVGQVAISGVVGLFVLAALLVVVVVTFSQMFETGPTPESFPPRE